MSRRTIAARRAGLSTVLVENHWGKAVDNLLHAFASNASRVFVHFLASVFALSTMPVDKPADSDVGR
ncbi:hypothetical protein AB4Y64_15855 [Lysobacter sp. TAF61]|uniref:hypothetical protein n=1 Tax=Lysobacter sp. TAF61 TaxID=3233072 RepID=UPI003F9620F1